MTEVPYPLLVLEAAVLVLLVSLWLLKRRPANRPSAVNAKRAAQLRREGAVDRAADGRPDRRLAARTAREMARHTPIPWGWPHHELHNDRSLGEQVAEFGHRLVRRRQLSSSRLSDPRVVNSIRALIEDRYQRVDRLTMPAIEYEKVKPPRLRDPSAEPDQMDDFGRQQSMLNGRTLPGVGQVVNVRPGTRTTTADSESPVRIENIRRPWGW